MGLMNARDVRFTIADGKRTLRAVHRLRYDVYVREFGFFSPVKHTDDLLVDAYDGAGLHPIALEGDEVVGALRMVLHSDRGFPLAAVLPHFRCPGPPEKTAEISHLVIDKRWRRRREDGLFGAEGYLTVAEGGVLPNHDPLPPALKRRRRPVIVLGLLRTAYQLSRRMGIEWWLMLAEKRLHALLNRHGIPFYQMADPLGGPDGPRPSLLTVSELESHLKRLNESLFEEFLEGLEPAYRPTV